MKLPYKRGDSFAMPLGNGQFARSCITQCEHRVVIVAIEVGKDAPLVVRVSDDALVAHRWKIDGRHAIDDSLQPQNHYWMSAAKAEQLAAAAIGAPHPPQRRRRSIEVLDSNLHDALALLDDDTTLALTEPLESSSLDALTQALAHHRGAGIRLHGGALEHLDTLARTPLERLTLIKPRALAACPAVRRLTIIGRIDTRAVVDCFPNLHSLHIDANGAAVSVAPLHALTQLRTLDLAAAALLDAHALRSLQTIRDLRISRVTGIRDPGEFAQLPLRALAVEHLHELLSVDALRALQGLEQLELLGLWQFEIGDLEWALELPKLVRCEIDIGGRRKNVELYKRAHWAYPWAGSTYE